MIICANPLTDRNKKLSVSSAKGTLVPLPRPARTVRPKSSSFCNKRISSEVIGQMTEKYRWSTREKRLGRLAITISRDNPVVEGIYKNVRVNVNSNLSQRPEARNNVRLGGKQPHFVTIVETKLLRRIH